MMPNSVRLHQTLPDAPTELVEELSRRYIQHSM
jgi:hypothetical protein